MARPRTFDPDEVLDLARKVFWKKGFQATSLDDITEVSGVAKPSLYAAFGDKTALYQKILDRYHGLLLNEAEQMLWNHASAREAIEAWLISFVPRCSGARGKRGCLSINTAMDGGLDDDGLARSVGQYNAKLLQLVEARLQADRAQFSRDFDPEAAAQTLLAVYSGLMVLAKQSPKPDVVKSIISQLMKLLI